MAIASQVTLERLAGKPQIVLEHGLEFSWNKTSPTDGDSDGVPPTLVRFVATEEIEPDFTEDGVVAASAIDRIVPGPSSDNIVSFIPVNNVIIGLELSH